MKAAGGRGAFATFHKMTGRYLGEEGKLVEEVKCTKHSTRRTIGNCSV